MEAVIKTGATKHRSTKALERELIKSLAGSYEVTFKFAETFSPDKNYRFHDRYFSAAQEVAVLIEDSEDKISIQHILVAGRHLIKHWRQDWLYENREIWTLVKGHEWRKMILSANAAKGTWTQKVYQVDDAPRYEGYGTWVHVDGRHFWESTADAALPRREIITAGRKDYNILRRHSHIEIFDDGGWVLEQDNKKINQNPDGSEILICMEKGLETFEPISFDTTEITRFWKRQENFWADVRREWEGIRATLDHITITDDETLYNRQFELARQYEGKNYDRQQVNDAIQALFAAHVEEYPR